MDELTIGEKVYIPSKRAAAITGYAKDYIGQLCREGRIEARLVGRSWYVLESSVREHRFGKEAADQIEEKAVNTTVQEDTEIDKTWKSPSYTAESAPSFPVADTSYLENTASNGEEEYSDEIVDTQSAWQEWFATHEASQKREPVNALSETQQQEEIEEETVDSEERGSTVQIKRLKRSVLGSMDIQPKTKQRAPHKSLFAQQWEKETKFAQVSSSKNITIASFVAFVLIILSLSLIGMGVIDASNNEKGWNSFITDFLGGVQRIEK